MKILLLILDGLGVGEMRDVAEIRPRDKGSNTFKHIMQLNKDLKLPNFEKLGMGNLGDFRGIKKISPDGWGYGKCKLAHTGADTYMGHQELMGSEPKDFALQILEDVGEKLEEKLEEAGHKVSYPANDRFLLLVDDYIVIGDNMESDIGQSFVVTSSRDQISYEETVKVGKIVRDNVKVSRVIVGSGKGFKVEDMLGCVRVKEDRAVGIDMAELGIFNDDLQVKHLGYPVDIKKQMPYIMDENGFDVYILGKAADVVNCPPANEHPIVNTEKVLKKVLSLLKNNKDIIVIANIQQTDQAGHEQDASRYANLLKIVDKTLPKIESKMNANDLFIITGDHGNDPTSGYSLHTREFTPLFIKNEQIKNENLGIRETLADVSATICDKAGTRKPEYGISIFENENNK